MVFPFIKSVNMTEHDNFCNFKYKTAYLDSDQWHNLNDADS